MCAKLVDQVIVLSQSGLLFKECPLPWQVHRLGQAAVCSATARLWNAFIIFYDLKNVFLNMFFHTLGYFSLFLATEAARG